MDREDRKIDRSMYIIDRLVVRIERHRQRQRGTHRDRQTERQTDRINECVGKKAIECVSR